VNAQRFPSLAANIGRHVGAEVSYRPEATRRHITTAVVFDGVQVAHCHATA
jgi:hypothetical protein